MKITNHIDENGYMVPANLTFEDSEKYSNHIPSTYDGSPASLSSFYNFLREYEGLAEDYLDNFFKAAKCETVKLWDMSADAYFLQRMKLLRDKGEITIEIEERLNALNQDSWVPDDIWNSISHDEAWESWDISETRYHAFVDKWIEDTISTLNSEVGKYPEGKI